MAGSVNKVFILGRLGRDPEKRSSPTGQSVVNFTIATDDGYTDREGNRVERTEWHRIVTFGQTADLCDRYLRKGRQAFVEGRLQTREYENREGQRVKTTEIIADRVTFVGDRPAEGGAGGGGGSGGDYEDDGGRRSAPASRPASRSASRPAPKPSDEPPPDDDIPF